MNCTHLFNTCPYRGSPVTNLILNTGLPKLDQSQTRVSHRQLTICTQLIIRLLHSLTHCKSTFIIIHHVISVHYICIATE